MRTWAGLGWVALATASCTFPEYEVGTGQPPVDASICTDGVASVGETGVDCGGLCPPCGAGQSCSVAKDCESGVCQQQICQSASCNDSLRNGDETDVDCGGICSKRCMAEQGCQTAHDCETGVCAGTCQAPSCTDQAHNGTETDIDCGGDCSLCDNGQACKSEADCASGLCKGSLCVSSGCSDGKKNADETDIDCGGTCSPCAKDQGCKVDQDCASLSCSPGDHICASATCSDGVRNGTESDIDCGGGCAGCVTAQACNASIDCQSATCKSGTCVPSAETGTALERSRWQASASSNASDCPPNNALDGAGDSRWASGKEQVEGMWFTVDMQQPQAFFAITLDAHQMGDQPQHFDVYLSNDGQFTTPIKTNLIGADITTIHFDSAQYARYLHFVLDAKGSPGKWWSIFELNVYE